jgi:hypothetical protein
MVLSLTKKIGLIAPIMFLQKLKLMSFELLNKKIPLPE